MWHFFIYFYLFIKADLHSVFFRYFLWAYNYSIELDSIILSTQLKKSANCFSFFKIFQTMMRKINICQQLILEITVESNILHCLSLFDKFSVNNLISVFFFISFHLAIITYRTTEEKVLWNTLCPFVCVYFHLFCPNISLEPLQEVFSYFIWY